MSKELDKVLSSWEAYAFSTNLDERNYDLCKAITEITQAAANKAAEEGELPALKFDVETSDELTDTQNQHVNNLRTLNELLICFSSWEPQVCVVGNVRAGDSVNAIRQAIAADRAARPVANKAEVEPAQSVSALLGEAPQADAGDLPLDVEFKQLADKILQATTNGTRLEALRSMAVLFDKQAEQNVPAATLSPLCGGKEADAAEKAAAYDELNRIAELHGFASAAAAIAVARRATQQAAAPADCSGTPSSCPDNEGYGCHCSAPGTPEAPKQPAHGHRDDYYLLANGRRLGLEPISRVRNMPNWVLAMELFATGSTSAHQICRDAGIDPDSTTIQRAAQLDGGKEGSD